MWDRGFRHAALLRVNGTGSHALTVPYPYNGPLYMVAGPEPVDISMIEFDLSGDRFSVGGLPGNVPYVISDGDGNDVGAGVTSGSGSISRTLGSISRDMEPGDGGVLRLYPGAPHYDGYINVVSFDMRNNARVDNHQGSNSTFAYVPVIYARLAFIADAQVDHVTLKSKILGDINMDHLAGSYLKNQALMVPILPGATALDLTINGFEMSVLVSDLRVERTSGLIAKETNSYTGNTIGNSVSARSAVTSNAFAIATSNGTMTADVTVWLTGEAEMSLDTKYVIEADINRCYVGSAHQAVTYYFSHYTCSLFDWHTGDGTNAGVNHPSYYFDATASGKGHPTLSDIRSQVGVQQQEINREYKESINSRLRTMGNGPMVASVDVYRNGDFVKTVSLSGGGTPSASSSSSVSGLPSGYWPPGTIRMISISNPGVSNNVVSTYPTSGTYRMHQEIDIAYPPSTPQVLVDVEVDTGDMVQFVVQAQLGTRGLYAPSPVSVTTDLRMTVTDTTISSTGYRDATITIEGGAIEIFCCSE